jgi:hypothetical protein
MVRTQIQLTESQAKALKSIARKEGVSMAEVIRVAVDRFLQSGTSQKTESEQILLAKEAIGKYSCDRTDLAANHDRYFAGDDK